MLLKQKEQQKVQVYLVKTALTESLTGMLAIVSPPLPMFGSITWHLRIGWSFIDSSRVDLKVTWSQKFHTKCVI